MFLVEAYKIPTVVNTIGASVNGHKPVSEPDITNWQLEEASPALQ